MHMHTWSNFRYLHPALGPAPLGDWSGRPTYLPRGRYVSLCTYTSDVVQGSGGGVRVYTLYELFGTDLATAVRAQESARTGRKERGQDLESEMIMGGLSRT